MIRRFLPCLVAILPLAACGGEASKYAGSWKRDLYGEGEVKMKLASNGDMELMLPDSRWPAEVDMKGRAAFKGDTIVFTADKPHAYVNPSSAECWMYLVMTYAR